MIRRWLWIPVLAWSLGAAAADGTRLSLGLYASSGDYGTPDTTEIRMLSLGLKHQRGPWTFKLTLPWLRIEGASNVLPDGTTTGGSSANRRREGMGDVIASVGRRLFYDRQRRLGASLRAKVKLPTADADRALGTGEPDYTLELAPFGLLGRTTLFGALGYRWYGDTAATDYRDVWLARLGFSHPVTATQSLGLSAGFRQANRAGRDDRRSLTLFHGWEPAPHWKLQSYLIKGFSDATADIAGGMNLSRTF